MTTATQPATIKTFEVGTTYFVRSTCDHNCVWVYTVTARTAKTLTLKDDEGQVIRRRVSVWSSVEQCQPHGSYSMSPVLSAERIVQ